MDDQPDQTPDELVIRPMSDPPSEFEATRPIPVVPPVEPVVEPVVPPATTVMPVAPVAPVDPRLEPAAVVPLDEPPWRSGAAPYVAGLIILALLIGGLLWWALDDDDDELVISSATTVVVSVPTTSVPALPATSVPTTVPPTTPTTTPSTQVATTTPVAATAPTTPTTVAATTPTTVAAPAPTTTVAQATTTLAPAATTTVAMPTTTLAAPVVTPAPSPNSTLLDVVDGNADLSRLMELVEFAGIAAELDAEEPRTLLAPSNQAIDAFAATTEGAALLSDPEQVRQLLLAHLVDGSLASADVLAASSLDTLAGTTLAIDRTARTIDGAKLLVTDVPSANGVLHVVSAVLSGSSS